LVLGTWYSVLCTSSYLANETIYMFKFVTSRPLWVNILTAITLVCVVFLLFMLSLKWCTKHGTSLLIPQVTGMTYSQAQKVLEDRGFDVEIQDSVYFDTMAPLTVTKQFPEADAVVKKNRTVYLTVNRVVPPTIEMPKLTGLTFRTAEGMIKQYGLKLEDTTYKIDFAKNSVLDQLYNGESIKPGAKIQMGSSITLVLGTGVGGFEFAVPDLFGLTYDEARMYLQANGLTIGVVVPDPDVRDTLNAYVYRQIPPRMSEDGRFNRIRGGQTIDVWLSVVKPVRQVDSSRINQPDNNY